MTSQGLAVRVSNITSCTCTCTISPSLFVYRKAVLHARAGITVEVDQRAHQGQDRERLFKRRSTRVQRVLSLKAKQTAGRSTSVRFHSSAARKLEASESGLVGELWLNWKRARSANPGVPSPAIFGEDRCRDCQLRTAERFNQTDRIA